MKDGMGDEWGWVMEREIDAQSTYGHMETSREIFVSNLSSCTVYMKFQRQRRCVFH